MRVGAGSALQPRSFASCAVCSAQEQVLAQHGVSEEAESRHVCSSGPKRVCQSLHLDQEVALRDDFLIFFFFSSRQMAAAVSVSVQTSSSSLGKTALHPPLRVLLAWSFTHACWWDLCVSFMEENLVSRLE